MAMLKSIHIQGFKSIRDARVELGRVNVLIGANASGKSNLVAFFRMLRAVTDATLRQYVAQSGGPSQLLRFGQKVTPNIKCSCKLETDKSVSLEYEWSLKVGEGDWMWLDYERIFQERLSEGQPRLLLESFVGLPESRIPTFLFNREKPELHGPAFGVIDLLGSVGVFQFHDTSGTAAIRRSVYLDDNRQLANDGSNLAAVLHKFAKVKPAFYRRIVATVRQVFPQLDDFVLEPDALAPTQIKLNWRERGQDNLFGPHQLSDGTLRFIALATLLLQPEEELPKVIVIDEPELGLHPYAIGILASLVKAASRHCQVIVATQSVTLLDQFDVADVIVVERDRVHYATEFRRLSADELAVWKDEYENPIALGELWERNIIGGGPH